MGSFYGNVVVVGATLQEVADAIPRPAFVVEAAGSVVVFAEADEPEPTSAPALSRLVSTPVVAAAVFDDDLLGLAVHRGGELLLEGSVPDAASVFDLDGEDGIEVPAALDADQLVAAVGRGDAEVVRQILAADHVFVTDCHRQLLSALDLPVVAAGWGYGYLSEQPDEGPERQLLR